MTVPTRDELIVAHVPLVAHLVREALGRVPGHVDRDDLNSAGLCALVQAARAYDETRGVPFSAYAAVRVRGAIQDELRASDWAARSVRRRGRMVEAARAGLTTRLRRVPEDAQVAAELGLSLAELQRSDDDLARASVLSLEAALGEDTAPVAPGPTPDLLAEHRERLQYLTEAVEELPERLREVVRGYYLHERPMAELAVRLGVSESRVSQLRAEALEWMREALHTALDPAMVAERHRPDGAAARRRELYARAVEERHAAGSRPTVATYGLRTAERTG